MKVCCGIEKGDGISSHFQCHLAHRIFRCLLAVFTAVRFFDQVAYAVTFRHRDPFYVITFAGDPATPVVMGEVDVRGFSSYIQPINQNNTLVLALGMDTESDGISHSLQLSLFDATNVTNPKLVHRYVVGANTSELWSWSTAQYDFQAFRYVPIDEERGRIIIPVYYIDLNGTTFDGFSVFSLSPSGIASLFEISHYDSQEDDIYTMDLQKEEECYSCGYLLDRSFAIDGNVITLKGQSARCHSLSSGEFLWALNFTGTDFCCGNATTE